MITAAPHEVENGEALGWIKKLGVKKFDGKQWLCITELQAASDEAEQELIRLLSGAKKYNSPELDLARKIESEVYSNGKTSNWPEEARDKYYLRRVNLYGAEPIAQFNMPQAQLAEIQSASIALSESSKWTNYLKCANDELDKSRIHATPITDEMKNRRHAAVIRQACQFAKADHPEINYNIIEGYISDAWKNSPREAKRSLNGVSNPVLESYREHRKNTEGGNAGELAIRQAYLVDPAAVLKEVQGECTRYERRGEIQDDPKSDSRIKEFAEKNKLSYREAFYRIAEKNRIAGMHKKYGG